MIEMTCDKCKNKIEKITRIEHYEDVYSHGIKITALHMGASDLCDECLDKLEKIGVDIQDFMKMSDEDIELALYTFKVGDQVITDDGRVGTITDICTCESCKKRGFYEPRVDTEVGLYDIWITDTDKNNGFISYYKIGDKVFGNIDDEKEEIIKEDIHARKSEIISLEAQLNVLKKLKEENSYEEENI